MANRVLKYVLVLQPVLAALQCANQDCAAAASDVDPTREESSLLALPRERQGGLQPGVKMAQVKVGVPCTG
eukprot:CAMPEP_0195070902 /NCGR_PEP_ID=MMETSP0448-20130528/14845_1 /TAXON_ID=66468 /ORGANISM="Heterocapsa triquestra, Strain CCMP 448" /LENGTH=70 /DNA_ID=CAMNT_0040102673 /DNA_START=85 /DNA_END=294 /DNA_ORIENTATION=-